jgi:ribosome biogenesis SPOUT family RNA methylase Rps3
MLSFASSSSTVHFTHLSPSALEPLDAALQASSSSHRAAFKLHSQSLEDLVKSQNIPKSQVCLLDPRAPLALSPSDGEEGKFKYFVFGGILGDDPPRDRTSELRALGFDGRHLGEVQMTTDTALGVTKLVVEDKSGWTRCAFIKG